MATGSFIHLKQVLTPEELVQVRSLINQGQFQDGKLTASGAAVEVKKNEQLAINQQNMQIEHFLLQAIMRHPIIKRAVYA